MVIMIFSIMEQPYIGLIISSACSIRSRTMKTCCLYHTSFIFYVFVHIYCRSGNMDCGCRHI